MRTKSFGLFSLSIFAVVLAMGIASAATVFSDDFNTGLDGWTIANWSNPGTFAESTNQASSSLSRTISTSGFNTIVIKYDRQLATDWETTDNFKVSWFNGTTFTTLEEINGSASDTLPNDISFVSKTFNLPSSANNNSNFQLKFECATSAADEFCRIDNLVVEGTVTPVQTSVPPEVTSCSTTGNPGDLDVKGISFQNNGMQYNTFGKDDEWFPFEEIEAEIKVENNGNNDVDDISVEWGVWDTDKQQWVIDLDEEDEINLKDGKDETLILTFKIDDDMDASLDELSDGDNYRFYVVATGTVDNSTSPETCVSDFEQVSIVIESDFVVLDNFDVPETVQCSETVTITADAWNIGDNDQDEVSVLVNNRELGLSEEDLAGDIDAFDNQKVSLTFTVPSDAEEKSYGLDFEVLDEDSDVYKNDFDDDLSDFRIPLQVSGNCGGESGTEEASVVANIVSGGRAGQELVVRATITNNANTQKTYALNVAGYSDLASSFSLDQNTLSLNKGESKNVLITLDVNRDAAGSKTFFLELVSDGKLTRQPVTVSISEGAAGITGFITEGNWYLWGIGLLNIVLIIIIIVVAVRIARK
ncbi:MAG: putative S-layer protein [Nanoarchaeota archaeon]